MKYLIPLILILTLSCDKETPYKCIYAIELEADSVLYAKLGDQTDSFMQACFKEFSSIVAKELNILVVLQSVKVHKDYWHYPIPKYGYENGFIDSVGLDKNWKNNRMVLDAMPPGVSPWEVPWYCFVYYYDFDQRTASYNAIGWDLKEKDIQHYMVGCMLHEFGHILRMNHIQNNCTAMSVCNNWRNTYHPQSVLEANYFLAEEGCPPVNLK